jgi:hypothetical protein
MEGAVLAVLAAIGGGLITAAATFAIAYFQRASALRDAHRLRAFERHLAAYERIFVTSRSVLDAFNDYEVINKRVTDKSDPFLHQLLDILNDCCYQYCSAVDWRHNSGMAYLDMKLEERCLHLRDYLLRWLSGDRSSYGDVVAIRNNGKIKYISSQQLSSLGIGDYQELRIERRALITSAEGDAKLVTEIRAAATSVIKELKDVMAY